MTNVPAMSESQRVCLESTEFNKSCVDHTNIGFCVLPVDDVNFSPGAGSTMEFWEIKVIGRFCGKSKLKLLAGK